MPKAVARISLAGCAAPCPQRLPRSQAFQRRYLHLCLFPPRILPSIRHLHAQWNVLRRFVHCHCDRIIHSFYWRTTMLRRLFPFVLILFVSACNPLQTNAGTSTAQCCCEECECCESGSCKCCQDGKCECCQDGECSCCQDGTCECCQDGTCSSCKEGMCKLSQKPKASQPSAKDANPCAMCLKAAQDGKAKTSTSKK